MAEPAPTAGSRRAAPRRVVVVGIGMGPQHVTPEAVAALARVDVVVAFAKEPDDGGEDPLLAVRRAVCEQHGLPLVVVADPPRDRQDGVDYAAAVEAWHHARVGAYERVLSDQDGVVGLLVWGDPGLYDSTLRLLDALAERVPLDVEVVPGLSSLQLLAARHRVVLHDVGEPLHVTTARRLPEALAQGQRNLVVMLTRRLELDGLEDWSIWWGANLGADGEALVAGRVGDVLGELEAARARAKEAAGWVLDLYLLRAPAASEVA